MAVITLDLTKAPFTTLILESISEDHGKTLVFSACQWNIWHIEPSSPKEGHMLEACKIIHITWK